MPGSAARGTGPVRPIDAASLVLVRRGSGAPEILMGRRARRHRFLPDFYVFPGGRVDRGDHRVEPHTRLSAGTEAALARVGGSARARALAVAAVRETLEETGLLLGELRAGRLRPSLDTLEYIVRAITPSASPIRFHARFFMADAACARGELRSNGELLDLGWRALDACRALPIADITEFVLERVRERLRDARPLARVPVFSYRYGRASIRT